MIIEDGDIVWSKAGHDKGGFFVVIKSDERFCWISNGRSRKFEAPKKKNRIHLSATNKNELLFIYLSWRGEESDFKWEEAE